MNPGVRVTRNTQPDSRDEKPWLVYCAICTGNDPLFSMFLPTLLGFGTDWRSVYDFALNHALAHESQRCTTCLHLPGGPLTTVKRP